VAAGKAASQGPGCAGCGNARHGDGSRRGSCLRHGAARPGWRGAGSADALRAEGETSETAESCDRRRSGSAAEPQGAHRTILKELQETRPALHLLAGSRAGCVRAPSAPCRQRCPVRERLPAEPAGMRFPLPLQEASSRGALPHRHREPCPSASDGVPATSCAAADHGTWQSPGSGRQRAGTRRG